MGNDYPYLTTAEAAVRVGITRRRMTALCVAGKVPGARRNGHVWMVPEGFRWDRHNTGPKPKNGAPKVLSSPESRRSAPDRLAAASDSAAAIVTTTESRDSGRRVLDRLTGPGDPTP